MLKRILPALLLTILGGALAHAADLPKGTTYVTSVEGITEYRLDNGLRVLLFPDPSKETITVNVTYLVGSRHESYGETGMAHLLEHMVFKGTPRHPDIPKELAERGARPNGTTSFDRTNYFETFAASDDNLRWALDLEADRMVNSFIAKKDLDTEMTVVRNEFERSEDSLEGVLYQRVRASAFHWHNYGKSPIGSRADVENVPIERLQAFYRTWYQPDNAVLTIAGRFDPSKALSWVGEFFGPIPKPTRTLPRLYTVEPSQDGERTVSVRRVSETQLVMVAYRMPGPTHPDAAALDLLTTSLADAPSGRLHQALVDTRKAAAVFAFVNPSYDPDLVVFGAQVAKDGNVEAARDAILQTLAELGQRPLAPEELDRARTRELKQHELAMNDSGRIGLALSNYLGMGDWRLMFWMRDRWRAVTVADVQRAATRYLVAVNRTVGLAYATGAPGRVEIPPGVDVASLLKDYKGDPAVAQGEIFDPAPANIEARTTYGTLASGLKTALLPKKTRGGAVQLILVLRYGDEASLQDRQATAQLAAGMLMRGTTKRNRTQLKDELDRINTQINVSSSGSATTFTLESTREHLPAALALLGEIAQRPAFPAAEFESLKQERQSGIERVATDPGFLAQTTLERHLSPYPANHIRYTPTAPEMLAANQAVTLEDVRAFHRQFFGASAGELVVAGDFDARQTRAQLGKLFGAWKSRNRYERLPRRYFDVAAQDVRIPVRDKANAALFAGLNLPLRDSHPDYPALLIANHILGSSGLSSRLAMRLRQQEGLSYGTGSALQVAALDDAGTFYGNAIYAPQNVAKVAASFRDELRKLRENGLTSAELEAAKGGWQQSRRVGFAQDRELVGALGNQLFAGRTMAWQAALEQQVRDLTVEQVNAAVRRHFDFDRISIVQAGDFAKEP
jgi:zinc protease